MKSTTPSQRTLRKLEALRILTSKVYDPMEIAATLKADGILSERTFLELRSESDKTEKLFILLEQARSDEKIDLLDYEWVMLPTHFVKLTIVTKYGLREFQYGE
jgi:hypothetical protein